MSRVRTSVALLVLSVAALIAAPGVLAASPQQIYDDYADNGQLDGTYSRADLKAALTNATVQGYQPDKETGIKPAIEKEINSGGTTSGGTTAGGTAGATSGGSTPSAVTTSGGLPFTGLDLGLIAAGAAGLLLLGMGLRRVARQRS
jgi:hypothetical protein